MPPSGGTGQPLASVYLGGGTPTLLPSDVARRPSSTSSARGSASRTGRRSRSSPTPGRTSGATRPALVAAGVNRLSLGAQAFDAGVLRRLGRRHRPEHVADGGPGGARGRDRVGLGRPAVRRAGPVARDAGRRRSRRRSTWAWTTCRVRPDARRPGRGGPDGPDWATTCRRRRARGAGGPRRSEAQDDDRAAAQYRLAVDRLAAAGFRGLRDLQLGAAGPREPPQPRLLEPRAVRGGGPRRPRVRRVRAPLERGAAGRVPGRARARRATGGIPRPTRPGRRCRPAAPRPSTPMPRRRRP